MHNVVVFTGDAQPKVKLVVLVAINVGNAEVEVTFTVLVLQQPLIELQVNTVVVPGKVTFAIDIEPFATTAGP